MTTEVPKCLEQAAFLEKKLHVLQSFRSVGNPANSFNSHRGQGKTNLRTAMAANHRRSTCAMCQATDHNVLFKCSSFMDLDVDQRIKKAKELNLWLKCLLPARHSLQKCKFNNCKIDLEVSPQVSSVPNDPDNISASEGTSLCTRNNQVQEVMLSIAIIPTFDRQGVKRS